MHTNSYIATIKEVTEITNYILLRHTLRRIFSTITYRLFKIYMLSVCVMICKGSSMPKQDMNLRPLCIFPVAHIVDCTVSNPANPDFIWIPQENAGVRSTYSWQYKWRVRFHFTPSDFCIPVRRLRGQRGRALFLSEWGDAGVWSWDNRILMKHSQTHSHGKVHQRDAK